MHRKKSYNLHMPQWLMHQDVRAKLVMFVRSKRSEGVNSNGLDLINFAVQIRCSGERPSCKRCVRLKNTCEYGTNLIHPRQKRNVTRAVTANGASQSVGSRRLAPVALPANLNAESVSNHAFFQGIAPSLVNTLVELYFDNVYQSTLLLHKTIFMQSLADQTVKPHILLSICAWGAK